MQFIKATMLCFISVLMMSVSNAEEPALDFYSHKVQPIFDNRCLACHSCFNAPCQLNLQNYEAFQRGASKLNIYDGTRTKSVEPSRIWIDAHGAAAWRKKGFYDVNSSTQPETNLFLSFLNLRIAQPVKTIEKQVADTQVCAATMQDYELIAKNSPQLGMPYGLPPLSASEMATLETWIKKGAPGPSEAVQKELAKNPVEIQKQVEDWEKFLNEKSLTQRLVSRYLYEHLFLAHIYFPEKKNEFFRLVRSKTPCSEGIQEIATRRPNDDPGVKRFSYCLRKFPGSVVMKTHIPYEWSPAKLSRYKKIFWEKEWEAKSLPSYEPGVAENPFIAFNQIPVKARYQFLLDDAQYQVSTFIKGPVCNGSMAVNSIQEQFYVFFLTPESDNMLRSKEYEDQAQSLLMMPGVWGSDVEIKETPLFLKQLVDHREKYRGLRTEWLKKLKPEGYVLNDIWDGDKENPNAVLTVFRHDDNAVVLKGAVGDLSKTVFVLDYPLLERLVYNLVVNFDVFGNVSHQLLTRVYMDMIRMEAEELFLMFLPPEQRLEYRRKWYQGLLAQAKMTYVFPTVGSAEPTGVRFTEDKTTKKQMVEKILFYRLSEKVRGSLDTVNWKNLETPDSMKKLWKVHGVEKQLRKISSVKAEDETPFARYFPDLAYLKMQTKKGDIRVFSIIHNKEHENISWILGESLRMSPKEDSLSIQEGYWGSYPNMIFDVKEKDLATFAMAVKNIKSEKDYQALVTTFGVRRTQDSFWNHYDEITAHFRRTDPVQFGFLDLTRYELK
ncbi:fatty acid cis/trans isomerase [Bdellovibrio sp. HCB-110]|uniref:fatty acid cis/trans isomerase n=1 Tax=Bdellovibrio sp. HCB-110 TaxID=3391182 RepID=UPI0039B403B9